MDATFFTATLYGGFTTRGRPWQFSWHYRCHSPAASLNTLPEALAERIALILNSGDPAAVDVLSTGVFCTWVEVKSTYPPAYYPWGESAPYPGLAGGSEDLLPEGNGPLILFEAGFPSDAFPQPGRLYWPGIAETLQKNGSILDSYVETLEEFWENLEQIVYTVGDDSYTYDHVLLSPTVPAKGYQNVVRSKVADKIARVFRRGRTHQARWTP